MFKKVVWATDGSHNADLALAIAKTLAAVPGSGVVAVAYPQLSKSRG